MKLISISRHSLTLGICLIAIFFTCVKVFTRHKVPSTANLSDTDANSSKRLNQLSTSEINANDEREAAKLGLSIELYRKASRRAEQRNQAMIDAGMIVSSFEPVSRKLIGANGEISTDALIDAGISAAEKDVIQSKLNQLWSDMSAGMSANVTLNDKKTNTAKGIYVYKIAANSELGANLLSSFEEDLTRKYGKTSAKTLTRGLQKMQHFGNFGKLDVEIKFQKNKQNDKWGYEYNAVDPNTGKAVVGGSAGIESIHQTFGDIFDLSSFE
jgi:hypothetical protein